MKGESTRRDQPTFMLQGLKEMCNSYMQYFCGEAEFQRALHCESSDLVYFRNRIVEEGLKKILKLSIDLYGKEAKEAQVVIDTTVQERNVSNPTDVKLYRKIATECVKIAKGQGIQLRQLQKGFLRIDQIGRMS